MPSVSKKIENLVHKSKADNPFVNNFFEKKQKSSDSQKTESQNSDSNEVNNKESKNSITQESKKGENDSDEEWDDGTQYKTNKSNLLNRGKYNSKFDEDNNDQAIDNNVDINLNSQEQSNSQTETDSPKKNNKKYVRGAMDDFVRDSQDELETDAPTLKKKKRKLIEKVISYQLNI